MSTNHGSKRRHVVPRNVRYLYRRWYVKLVLLLLGSALLAVLLLPERYLVYCSESTEVLEEIGWGQSLLGRALSALLGFIARNRWWLIACLLALALLAAVIWYLREVSLRRLPVPGFVLAALIIHVLLGIGSFFVYFGEAIVDRIRGEFEEIVVATYVPEEHQAHERGEEPYEKVADLHSLETVDPQATRRTTEMPNVPVPTETSIPEIPTRLASDVPLEEPAIAPPEPELAATDPKLKRRQPVELLVEEQVKLD